MLNLPTEVVASQFLTMEGKQFSSSAASSSTCATCSRATDPTRCATSSAAAGPENQDADFTWAGVRPAQQRRARRRLGQPGQPDRDDDPQQLRRDPGGRPSGGRRRGRCWQTVSGGLRRPSARCSSATAEAGARRGHAGRGRGQRLRQHDQEPFRLKADDERERLGTILHVLAQAVSDFKTMMSPFLPHSSNRSIAVLGGQGQLAPMPRLDVVDDLDGGAAYPVITGDYTGTPRWESRPVVGGHADRASRRRCSRKFDPPGAASEPAPLLAGDRRTVRGHRGCRAGRRDDAAASTGPAADPGRGQPRPPRHRPRGRGRLRPGRRIAAASAVGVTRLVQVGCDLARRPVHRRGHRSGMRRCWVASPCTRTRCHGCG